MLEHNPNSEYKLENVDGLVATRSENDEFYREICMRFLA